MAQVKARLPAKSNKASSASPAPKATTKDSKSVADRKPTSKVASLPEVKENLKKVKEEKSKVVKELQEVKKSLSESNAKIQVLEGDVDRAKASERKMLESMVSQTNVLEGAKMELEEAKLEIKALKCAIQNIESSGGGNGRNASKRRSEELISAQEEIKQLKLQLKLATEAGEKSEGAMIDLTTALTEVATEANQMKEKFLASETELESLRVQADSTKSILRITQEELQSTLEESNRSKVEYEELLRVWDEKEKELRDCIESSEEQVAQVKQQNSTLIESQDELRRQISKLQDELKSSASEASIVHEALEKAREENSQLKRMFLEKNDSLQTGDQECTSMTSSSVEHRMGMPEVNASVNKSVSESKGARHPNSVRRFRSEGWRNEDVRTESNNKESSAGSGSLEDSYFTMIGSSEHENDQMLSSISSVSEHDDALAVNADEFHHVDGSQLGETQNGDTSPPDKKIAKKPMLQKLGGMFKGRRPQKQSF